LYLLIFTEYTALRQHFVDERRFAVVYVRDNRHVS
jgi:hypothetical protein